MDKNIRSLRVLGVVALLTCLCGCGGGGGGSAVSPTLYYVPGSFTGELQSLITQPGSSQIRITSAGAIQGTVYNGTLSGAITAQIGAAGQCSGYYTYEGGMQFPAGINVSLTGSVTMTQSPPYVLTLVLTSQGRTDTYTLTYQ